MPGLGGGARIAPRPHQRAGRLGVRGGAVPGPPRRRVQPWLPGSRQPAGVRAPSGRAELLSRRCTWAGAVQAPAESARGTMRPSLRPLVLLLVCAALSVSTAPLGVKGSFGSHAGWAWRGLPDLPQKSGNSHPCALNSVCPASPEKKQCVRQAEAALVLQPTPSSVLRRDENPGAASGSASCAGWALCLHWNPIIAYPG